MRVKLGLAHVTNMNSKAAHYRFLVYQRSISEIRRIRHEEEVLTPQSTPPAGSTLAALQCGQQNPPELNDSRLKCGHTVQGQLHECLPVPTRSQTPSIKGLKEENERIPLQHPPTGQSLGTPHTPALSPQGGTRPGAEDILEQRLPTAGP